jgi:dolichol kinase
MFVAAWGMEISRRRWPAVNRALMGVLHPFAHPHEYTRVNSSTWYSTALMGLSYTSTPMVCSLAVVVLGVGDPMAAVIGRRWGRTKLASGRSLEGSLAFAFFGTMAAWAMLRVCYPVEAPLPALALAAGASIAGAAAELAVRRIDDNLAIPLAAAAGAALVGIAL